MEHDEPEPGEDVPLDAVDDRVGHLAVRGVPPPDEDVGAGQRRLGEAVLVVVERGRRGGARAPEAIRISGSGSSSRLSARINSNATMAPMLWPKKANRPLNAGFKLDNNDWTSS